MLCRVFVQRAAASGATACFVVGVTAAMCCEFCLIVFECASNCEIVLLCWYITSSLVSKSAPQFTPDFTVDLMWRGPTWPILNWFVMEGLVLHGQTSTAGVLCCFHCCCAVVVVSVICL